MEKQITKSWKTISGAQVEVVGKLITEKTNYSDGWDIKVDCCEILVDVKLDGKSQGSWIQELNKPTLDAMKAKGLPFTHKVGKLALTEEQVNIITSVRNELEATPKWQAKQETISKNRADVAKLEEHGVGWCDKCHSHCYGDCEAN